MKLYRVTIAKKLLVLAEDANAAERIADINERDESLFESHAEEVTALESGEDGSLVWHRKCHGPNAVEITAEQALSGVRP